MLTTYTVSTQHPERDEAFIVPVKVEAHAPLEAAEKRFAMQGSDSRLDTTALLVTGPDDSWVYPVSSKVTRTVAVSPFPLVV